MIHCLNSNSSNNNACTSYAGYKMSTSVVRQALQLFDQDFVSVSTNGKKKKAKDPMKLISTEKKGVKKKLRKLKKQKAAEHSSKTKAVKLSVEEYRKRLPKDHTQDNLYYLKQLSEAFNTESKITETILRQNRGPLAKNKPDIQKQEESTVFTDRDFDQFAKEYFS